jgi:hypothetical protein
MSLDKLFGNKIMQKMIFGKLQDFCKDHGVRAIVLEFNEKGEMKEPVFHHDETVTVTKREFENLIKS